MRTPEDGSARLMQWTILVKYKPELSPELENKQSWLQSSNQAERFLPQAELFVDWVLTFQCQRYLLAQS